MNLDRVKLVKAGVTLLIIFIVVISMSKIVQNNSLTLTEYADKHPELANNETEDSDEDANGEASANEDDTGNSSAQEDGNDTDSSTEGNGNSDGSTATQEGSMGENSMTEILQNETETGSIPTLTGAILNANIPEEQRITYTDSFYIEPLSDNLRRYITGVSFPSIVQTIDTVSAEDTFLQDPDSDSTEDTLAISYDELRYVHILHYDFDGKLAEGELICNEAIAGDLIKIFYELYRNEYQLERVLLIDEYDGDDNASMADNNTSCFNYRTVEGSTSLSKHALGLAIDINPFYNPYITYNEDGSENVSPAGSEAYADREASFPYKIDENDLCYKLFTSYGFTWGGNWNSCKDYQHFQKSLN